MNKQTFLLIHDWRRRARSRRFAAAARIGLMKKCFSSIFGVSLAVLLFIPTNSHVSAASVNGSCRKAGTMAGTTKKPLVCKKIGKKLLWQAATIKKVPVTTLPTISTVAPVVTVAPVTTSIAPVTTPTTIPTSAPVGATAQCRDGTYSYSQTRSGTCSRHGGVSSWL